MYSALSDASEPLFGPILDRIFRLDTNHRRAHIERVRRAVDSFNALGNCDRPALVRSIVLNEMLNRRVFALHTRFWRIAAIVARCIPIVGARASIARVPPERPVIVALMHFGPIHLAVAALMRSLNGRTLYVLHAGGETGNTAAEYFGRIGAVPVVTDRRALSFVVAEMGRNPNTALLLAFDHIGGKGRRSVPFLGARLEVATSIGYLARTLDAAVVTCWFERSRLGPRVRIDGSYAIDARVPEADREAELVDRMFAILERRVRTVPQEWTEWANCVPADAMDARGATTYGRPFCDAKE